MKQINYLLLATILFFSNCSNDNGVEEMLTEPIRNITEADLVGNWEFVSLEFEGKTYTDCDNNDLKDKYNLTNLSFFNVTLKSELYDEPTLIYYSDCGCGNDTIKEEIKFKIENNEIILNDNDKYKYSILNFNGETLIIKSLLNAKKVPTSGIYTLKKKKKGVVIYNLFFIIYLIL